MMNRYIRLFCMSLIRSLIRELSFKVNFLLRFFANAAMLIIYYIFYSVIFSQTNYVAGWNKDEVLILLGTFHIIYNLFLSIFFNNLSGIPFVIRSGILDSLITKPINIQYLISINNIDIASLGNVFLGIILLVISVSNLGLEITIGKLFIYIFSEKQIFFHLSNQGIFHIYGIEFLDYFERI